MPVCADKAAPEGSRGCVMRSHLWVILIASGDCTAGCQPVCAEKNGPAVGYLNACLARGDGAASITLGHCSPGD
jgi:hypothetical protein